jgi:hypothetical protein
MKRKKSRFPAYEELFKLAEDNKLWVEIELSQDGEHVQLSLVIKEMGEDGSVLLSEPIDNIIYINHIAGRMVNKLGKKL